MKPEQSSSQNKSPRLKRLAWKVFYRRLAKRGASANVIIEDEAGRLLVVKAHYKPYWSLPGGWIDRDETPRQAAVREVFEELGVQLHEHELVFDSVITRISETADTYLFVFRFVKPFASTTPLRLQAKELSEYDWVTKDDIAKKRHGRHYNRAPKNWASEIPATYLEHRIN